MIINAGLDRVICSTNQGKIKIFNVDKWIKEWQKKDIVEDKDKYGDDRNN